jgi:hypothetical protein
MRFLLNIHPSNDPALRQRLLRGRVHGAALVATCGYKFDGDAITHQPSANIVCELRDENRKGDDSEIQLPHTLDPP